MKKVFLLIVALAFSASMFAQIALINHLDQQKPYEVYQNGTVIDVCGKPSDIELVAEVGVWNQGSSQANVILRRTNIDVIEGTSNYFCWGSCYGSNVSVSNPFAMEADFASFTDFSGHYDKRDHNSNNLPLPLGISTVRYSFYDENHPNDSAWVVVRYIVTETGVNEFANISSKVYPNPAKNQIVIESEIVDNGNIVIFNMVGQKVKEVALNSEKVSVNISDLPNGAYIYSIISNGQKLDSKRFVVSK